MEEGEKKRKRGLFRIMVEQVSTYNYLPYCRKIQKVLSLESISFLEYKKLMHVMQPDIHKSKRYLNLSTSTKDK